MKRFRLSAGLAVLLMLVLVGGTAASAGPAQRAPMAQTAVASYCGLAWGSGVKSGGSLSTAPLVATRVGRNTCWDRVVFEFNGTAKGYRVAYGTPLTEGQGLSLKPYTAGGAHLVVSLRAPAYDQYGHATVPYRVGQHVANVFPFRTLRDVVYGGSSEGYTTFAVGVRTTLPFRVFTLAGPGTHSRIVLDIAHAW